MRGFSEYKASALALIAANALPLFGVLFLGWDAFSIVFLYWCENVIIGAINVLKMIVCNPHPNAIDWSGFSPTDQLYRLQLESKRTGVDKKVQLANHGMKMFFVPFFVFQLGAWRICVRDFRPRIGWLWSVRRTRQLSAHISRAAPMVVRCCPSSEPSRLVLR